MKLFTLHEVIQIIENCKDHGMSSEGIAEYFDSDMSLTPIKFIEERPELITTQTGYTTMQSELCKNSVLTGHGTIDLKIDNL